MNSSGRITGTAAVVFAALLLAGCAAGARPAQPARSSASPIGSAASSPSIAPVVAPCASAGCHPGPSQPLTGGYSVRLWTSQLPGAASPAAERSTPVLELDRDGQHVSWWVGRLGYGWAATVRCEATPAATPNCVVISEVGAHAGSAEFVLLRDGGLVAPAQASAVFDSGVPVAADLDHDGQLDLVGVENDYQPNFATGHNYWVSYRLNGAALHQTGCKLVTGPAEPIPAALFTGRCPVVAQG